MSAALLEKIGEFQRRAELCERYAREATDELMRQQFLTTAENWRKLAAEAQRMASRMTTSNLAGGAPGAVQLSTADRGPDGS
jgi:hypothetical protein